MEEGRRKGGIKEGGRELKGMRERKGEEKKEMVCFVNVLI